MTAKQMTTNDPAVAGNDNLAHFSFFYRINNSPICNLPEKRCVKRSEQIKNKLLWKKL